MDVSHILVGGLTAISIALLVWIEIRSRRNAAVPEQTLPWLTQTKHNRLRRNETAYGRGGNNNGRRDADCGNRAGSDRSCSRRLHLSARSLPEVRPPSAR